MKIRLLQPQQSLGSNCYLVSDGPDAILVDPSVSLEKIREALAAESLTLTGILLTHGHFDHMYSLESARKEWGVPVSIHEKDNELLPDGRKNAFSVFFGKPCAFREADILFSDRDRIPVGKDFLTVMHTPGHTAGSCCFLGTGFLITGDTLFADGYGRCDLYSGDASAMSRSLASLSSLRSDYTIYPGHGPSSSLKKALTNAYYY